MPPIRLARRLGFGLLLIVLVGLLVWWSEWFGGSGARPTARAAPLTLPDGIPVERFDFEQRGIEDCARDQYLRSIPGLTGVAGVLVSEEHDLVFTSNRGENTVGIVAAADDATLVKVAVGTRPNGLAYDSARRLLLAANVGDPARPGSSSLSMVDVPVRAVIAEVPVPGRTRWAVFDAAAEAFHVNIVDPPQIVVIEAPDPQRLARAVPIPVAGPHGLDLDPGTGRLFCACDGQALVSVEAKSGRLVGRVDLGGVPDVVFVNPALGHVYVAIGDPGVIEVFETDPMRHVQTVPTEPGAHTMALDQTRHRVYALLPTSHRAAVYVDGERR
jgi:DNA-binding beta-propeller fold protein YncE